MNGTEKVVSAINCSSSIVIDANTITITASAPEKSKCAYCGSVIYGSRCESCGAPKK